VSDDVTLPGRSVDPLGLDEAEMRRLGHAVVDRVVDRWLALRDSPATAMRPVEELTAGLGGPIPREPSDIDAALDLLTVTALANMQQACHPRFFARVPSPASFAAVLGEWLSTGFNAISTSWGGGSGPTTVETTVVDWLRELMGMPSGAEGILVSGGSIGNVTAIAAARKAGYHGVIYLSDQTHSSIRRGLAVIGLPDDQIRLVPTGVDFRWSADAVAAAVAADKASGHRPAIVIASAGTTNTGAVDPLDALADLCAANGIWLHVDGAYGALAALTKPGRVALAGIGRADSLTLDPHKWLFQPYDVGCVLVRQRGVLEACFTMTPEYLRDVEAHGGETEFRNMSLELTRRARSIKIWLTVRAYGLDRIEAAVLRGIELAELAGRMIEADPFWQLMTPAQLGVVTFVGAGLSDADHVGRANALAESGYAAVSTTELGGRTVLRLCTINPLTTEADIAGTLQRLRAG
jgi:glutamate/tyrosine decarboxylase-like PLP-dependent enzyme